MRGGWTAIGGLADTAWQLSTSQGGGSAVYVGARQFLVAASLLEATLPWGVVSRGNAAHPVVRVASEPRIGLALVELIEREASVNLGQPIRFAATSDDLVDSQAWVVSYPAGDAVRHSVALAPILNLTERRLETLWPGWDRLGAPLIEPCSHPLGPTIDLKLDAHSGIELFAVVRHQREPCPGLPEEEQRYWQGTHVVQLRNTSEFDFDDLSLRIETETGDSYMSAGRVYDVDPDVQGWRFNVADGTPVRLIVTAPAAPGDS